jgi:hypothetical protein
MAKKNLIFPLMMIYDGDIQHYSLRTLKMLLYLYLPRNISLAGTIYIYIAIQSLSEGKRLTPLNTA